MKKILTLNALALALLVLTWIPIYAAFDLALNFRATAPHATDGASETYDIDDIYLTTRNGIGFGRTAGAANTFDDSATDRRLAGYHYNTTSATIRINLPASGIVGLHMGMGGTNPAGNDVTVVVKDDTSTLTTLGPFTATNNKYWDATGVERASAAAWVASEDGGGGELPLTFTTTIANFVISTSSNWFLNHIRLVYPAGGSPPPATPHLMPLLGVGN